MEGLGFTALTVGPKGFHMTILFLKYIRRLCNYIDILCPSKGVTYFSAQGVVPCSKPSFRRHCGSHTSCAKLGSTRPRMPGKIHMLRRYIKKQDHHLKPQHLALSVGLDPVCKGHSMLQHLFKLNPSTP